MSTNTNFQLKAFQGKHDCVESVSSASDPPDVSLIVFPNESMSHLLQSMNALELEAAERV